VGRAVFFSSHISCCIVVLACVQNTPHIPQCAVRFCYSSLGLDPRWSTGCYPCFVFVGLFSFATHICLFLLRLCYITLAIPSLLLSVNASRRKNRVLVFSKFLVTTAPSGEGGGGSTYMVPFKVNSNGSNGQYTITLLYYKP
jgi:hypothetical protein